MSIYKACDIRGRFGEALRVEHAARLGAAIACLKGPVTVLVAGDGRASTPLLKSTLIEALGASGCQVLDLGQAPTPLFYFARARLGVEVGVMVTASHNPACDNGFKVTLGPQPVSEAEMEALATWMESGAPPPAAPPGGCQPVDLREAYLQFLAPYVPDLRGFRLVIDCANGVAGPLARCLWETSGAQVTYLLEEVDGRFPAHPPNPAEDKNLALLRQTVVREGADLGIAYDGDADRVVFVDESGQALSNDRAIVLFARDALRAGPQVIVYDQKCSRVVPEAIRACQGRPVRERSGHTYIKRTFLAEQAAYAGELSGHHFFRATGGDDGLAASLFFARILKESGLALSRLAASVPAYPITPDLRVPVQPEAIDPLLEKLQAALIGEAEILRTDGLRFDFPDGWGMVRRSVTEPVVTMRFEGVDAPALGRILARVAEAAPELEPVLLQMGGDRPKARIHFGRIGKPEALYVEDLVRDDGVRLDTHAVIPPEFRKVWAKDAWIQQGIMAGGEVVREVRKHHFYNEWFDIIELFDEHGGLIGYYCDVITPLRKEDGEYYLLDLMLDLWVFLDGRSVELDWDELEAAAQAGWITPEHRQKAVETLRRMVSEVRAGIFPGKYLA